MVETLEEFYSRSYVVFGDRYNPGRVFVYPSQYHREGDGYKPEVWTLQTAKNYITWLENNQKMRMKL